MNENRFRVFILDAVYEIQGCIQKFPEWLDKPNTRLPLVLLVVKQYEGLWRQNSLDWLTK